MSTDFSITGDRVIRKALQKIGVIAVGEPVPSDELADCRITLNILLKNLMGGSNPVFRGLKTWMRERQSLTLDSKAKYTLAPSGGDLNTDIPIKIVSVRLKDTDDNETVLTEMSAGEYEEIGKKNQTSTPTRWFYERHIAAGYLYFDVIPSDVTDVAELTYLRTTNDIDDASDSIEFSLEYYRPVINLLAIDLASEYEMEVPASVLTATQQSTELVNHFEPDDSDAFFQPEAD